MPPRKRQQLPAARLLQPPPPTLSLADVDDLLMEILVRLPAKSLSRFKCVCKKWLSLISSDDLCHHHTLRRPKLQQSILFRTSCLSGDFFYLNPSITINGEKKMIPYSLSVPDYKILQACNGLMLLEHSYYSTTKGSLTSSYYVHNPTTRQSREIFSTYNEYVAIGLAFDPSKSPYYKIVCISSIEDDFGIYQIEVYDSESHTWKLSRESFPDNTTSFYSSGTYWNNAIYWICECGCCDYCCYDIGKNELKTLSCPRTPLDFDQRKHSMIDAYLQESDGRLYHFEYFNERSILQYEYDKELVIVLVWELVGHDDSQWIFKDHHRLTCSEGCDPYYLVRSIGGSGSGSEGDETCSLLTFWAGKMRAYRFLDKSYEDLLDLTIQPWYKPEYRKRSSVRYFQFGEVLALV